MFKISKKNKEKKRVLVVEDDALLGKVLEERLKAEGLDVLNVENGLEALDSVKKYKPHIILLDLILPGLDGFEVLRQLNSDKRINKIPVFIISNLDDISDVKSAKALKAEEYFIKANTQMEEIVNSVKKRIGK